MMKSPARLLGTAALASAVTQGQSVSAANSDDILGNYRNPDGSRTVRVYKENERYFGVIATAPEVPDGNEGVGYLVFDGFRYDPEQDRWVSGALHSPMYQRQRFDGILR